MRALSLLISQLLYFIAPHVGYSGEGVPLVLTAHSLMVLLPHLARTYCQPTLLLGAGCYPEGFSDFSLSHFLYLLYHVSFRLSSTFFIFFWLFFPFGGKVATLTNFYSLSDIAARHTYFFTRLSEIPWYFILERTF